MHTPPYHRFEEFIAPGADRYGLLRSLLAEQGLNFRPVDIAGNRHLFVGPGFSSPGGNGTVLVAHYDRVADSPGANDNSAAVFQLIQTARILEEAGQRRWLVIFTDKEELAAGEGIRDQGAYTLAAALRDTGMGGGQFYSFDACGVGDTVVISTMADHLMKDEEGLGIAKARRQVQQLRTKALETARKLNMTRILLAPTPFSDDVGFLRAGIAAQTITILPAEEASRLASLLRNKPDLAAALVSRDAPGLNRRLIPETWRSLNGPRDSYSRLTPAHFGQVVRFACALCRG
jgi:hypothetical protein